MDGRQLGSHYRRVLHIVKSGEHYILGNPLAKRVKRMLQIRGGGVVTADDRIWLVLPKIGAD